VAIKPGKVDRKALVLPIAFFFVAALFYVGVSYFLGEFSRGVGIVLLSGFVVYMITILWSVRGEKGKTLEEAPHEEPDFSKNQTFSFFEFLLEDIVVLVGGAFMIIKGGVIRYIGIAMLVLFMMYPFFVLRSLKGNKEIELLRAVSFLGIGAAVIAGGANLLVDSGMYIAAKIGIPDTVIALTFVALGTSLPELVTAITSLAKGHGALSLGNVIGANIFNLVLVSGVSTVISPFSVPAESTIAGHPASLVLDLPVMLGVMTLLTLPALIRGKLSRVQGIVLLCVYAGFCTLQFMI
jgi:Ca2+/Na+ antiporter